MKPNKACPYLPAEWELHRSCWVAWPSHVDLWGDQLEEVRKEFVSLCQAINDPAPNRSSQQGEKLDCLVLNRKGREEAATALSGLSVQFHEIPFGDIWLRDTAPLFLFDGEGGVTATSFQFNGWGGKYLLSGDDELSQNISKLCNWPKKNYAFILEGGSVEVDGEGTCLTTRQCLLNPNRNRGMTERDIESALQSALGVEKLLWIEEGLRQDHTDGHIDTLARFVAPGVVVCMEPTASGDPNREALCQIRKQLSSFRDAQGRRLEIVTIPSPGRVADREGNILPASYVNFYIGNSTVVVPTYEVNADEQAISRITNCFTTRRTVGCSARALLLGGGAFHCITQQEPLAKGSQN